MSVVLALLWLGISFLVCCLVNFNENQRRIKVNQANKVLSLKENKDSSWKVQMLSNLANMSQRNRAYLDQLDSLNKEVTQTVFELREINRILRIRKNK